MRRERDGLAVPLGRDRAEQRCRRRRRRTSSGRSATGLQAREVAARRERGAGAEAGQRRSTATTPPASRRGRRRAPAAAAAVALACRWRRAVPCSCERSRAASSRQSSQRRSATIPSARSRSCTASRRSLSARSTACRLGTQRPHRDRRVGAEVGHVDLGRVVLERRDQRAQVGGRAAPARSPRRASRAADRRVADRLGDELLVRDHEPVVVGRSYPGVGEADLLDDAARRLRSRPRRRAAPAG